MKRFASLIAMALLFFVLACSGGEEADTERRIYDAELKALDDAKKVESILLDTDAKRQKELEEMESN